MNASSSAVENSGFIPGPRMVFHQRWIKNVYSYEAQHVRCKRKGSCTGRLQEFAAVTVVTRCLMFAACRLSGGPISFFNIRQLYPSSKQARLNDFYMEIYTYPPFNNKEQGIHDCGTIVGPVIINYLTTSSPYPGYRSSCLLPTYLAIAGLEYRRTFLTFCRAPRYFLVTSKFRTRTCCTLPSFGCLFTKRCKPT